MAKQEGKKKLATAAKTQKLVATEKNGKWGIIDAATGEEIVPFKYDYVHLFSVGLALVQMNGWWGYVDKTGKEVIPLIYDEARYFNKDGKAKVKLDGEAFYIDMKGNRIE